jgi:gliding motility-associated-like protein
MRTKATQFLLMKVAFLMLMAVLCPSRSQAGHLAGSSLTYSCVNSCTIRIEFRAYRDCSSPISNISPIGTLTIDTPPGCVPPTPVFGWVNVSNIEVTPVCPGTPTQCNTPGAAIPGIMEHYWVRDYNFCASTCSDYTVEFQTCCRNAGIGTIFNPQSTGTYNAMTINPLLSPCNSSPAFTSPPLAYICQNQTYTFNQGATDPDGDSLSYATGPCMQTATDSLYYLPFTSPTQPLGSAWIVTLDSTTGDLLLSPDPSSVVPPPGSPITGVICIYVTEWRGGIPINTIVRDMQVNIIPCPPNVPPTAAPPQFATGGAVNDFTFTTCVGANFCTDFRILDPDGGQNQTAFWDMSLASMGATFGHPSIPSMQDTVVGANPSIRFCWSPTTAGTYTFNFTVRDDFCPQYGQNQYTVTIQVGEIATSATSVVSGCQDVQLCALPLSGRAPYTYTWTGAGGLSANPQAGDSCLFHGFPQLGQFPVQLQIADAWGCTATFLDTIDIVNNVVADAGRDTFTCANQPVIFGGAPQTNPDLLYSWTPTTGLGNANQPQPTATLPNPNFAPQTYPYYLTLTDTLTECADIDTMVLTVNPIPSSPFTMPDTTCAYTPVGLIYTGDNSTLASYDWQLPTGSPPSITGMGPHLAYWTLPGWHTVSLTVSQNGCNSPLQTHSIYVIPRPDAQIAPVADQCLANNSFNFQALNTFGPNATYQWQFWPNASPSTSTNPNPTGIVFSTPGIKRAVLQVTENGCPGALDTIYFTVRPDPNPNWMVIGGVQCFNGNQYAFQTTGANSGNAVFSWTFQDGIPGSSTQQNPVVSFSSPGPKLVSLSVSDYGCTAVRTDSIHVFPVPVLTAGPDVAFCAGSGGVQLSASASAGTPTYAYHWSCGQPICGIDSIYDDDPVVNPTVSGWYYVDVTDANGCDSNIDSVYVTVHPKPFVDAGPDVHICGDSAPCEVLQPTIGGGYGPYSYQWLPFTGLNSSTILHPCARPDSTTIYTLVATDISTGCSSDYSTTDTTSTVTVHVHSVPIAQAGHDRDICPGDSALLAGSGFGAGPDYQFAWSPVLGLHDPASPTPWASPAFTYTYSLTVWSNGCPSLADTVQVRVHTNPSIDAGWDREICYGESALLDATAGGDSTASYSFVWWQPVGLNDPQLEDPIASPATTTTYYVMAVTNWGCHSALDSVTVRIRPSPAANAGPNLQLCEGHPAQLQGTFSYPTTDTVAAGGYISYAWSPPLALSDPSILKPEAEPTVSTYYTLTVTTGLCTTQDTMLLTVVPDLQAGASADTSVICADDSVRLHAHGGLGHPQYLWIPSTGLDDPSAAHPMASPGGPTSYLLLISESGCLDSARVELDVLSRPTASFTHSALTGCPPLQVSLLNISGGTGLPMWDFGDGSPVSNADAVLHTYPLPGSYPLQFAVADTGFCVGRSAPVTVVVSPYPAFEPVSQPEAPVQFYLPAATLDLHDATHDNVRWLWDYGDGYQSPDFESSHQYTEAGTYFVTGRAWNAAGCMLERILGPYIVLPPALDIPNVFSPNGDGLYDRFLVLYQGSQHFTMQILDRWGATVFGSTDHQLGWDGRTQDGLDAPEGVYYYHITIGKKEYTGSLSLFR